MQYACDCLPFINETWLNNRYTVHRHIVDIAQLTILVLNTSKRLNLHDNISVFYHFWLYTFKRINITVRNFNYNIHWMIRRNRTLRSFLFSNMYATVVVVLVWYVLLRNNEKTAAINYFTETLGENAVYSGQFFPFNALLYLSVQILSKFFFFFIFIRMLVKT